VTGIRLAISIGVLDHHDSITFGLAIEVFAIANALCHPDTTIFVDVHVGWVVQFWGSGPEGDFQSVGDNREICGNAFGISIGKAGVSWPVRRLGANVMTTRAENRWLIAFIVQGIGGSQGGAFVNSIKVASWQDCVF